MGDIAFLLIIFFMVCSNFIKEAHIPLSPPKAADLVEINESPVSVSINPQGAIYLQGLEVQDAQTLEQGVSTLLADKVSEADRTVLFKCDESVQREVFEPVLEAIAQAGGLIAALGDKTSENMEPRGTGVRQ
jgi:biopolymer transport protein ExbD